MGLKSASTLIAILTLSLGASAAIAQETMSAQQAFEVRQQQMRSFGGTMRGLRSAEGDAMVDAANVYVEGFAAIPNLFPEDSIVDGSHALPAIWEDWDGFIAIVDKGNEAAIAMRIAAEAGDQAAFLEASQALGPLCQECHNTYRAAMN